MDPIGCLSVCLSVCLQANYVSQLNGTISKLVDVRDGRFLEVIRRSAFGIIAIYHMLPQTIVDEETYRRWHNKKLLQETMLGVICCHRASSCADIRFARYTLADTSVSLFLFCSLSRTRTGPADGAGKIVFCSCLFKKRASITGQSPPIDARLNNYCCYLLLPTPSTPVYSLPSDSENIRDQGESDEGCDYEDFDQQLHQIIDMVVSQFVRAPEVSQHAIILIL